MSYRGRSPDTQRLDIGALLGVLPTANGGTSVDIASAALPLGSGQISFPAVQSASAGANVLDDYEEGAWTPTLLGSTSGAATYTTQAGAYVKIGQQVIASFSVVAAGLGTLVGNLQLGGLPFTVSNLGSYLPNAPVYWTNIATSTYVNLQVLAIGSSTSANFVGATAATASLAVVNVNTVQANTTFAGQLMYRASA